MSEVKTYPKDTVGVLCTLKVNGVTITTTYAADDPMSVLTAGKGTALLTVYDASGVVANDSAGNPLLNKIMFRGATDGTAVYTISLGLPTAGEYRAHVVYGVNDSLGNPDWQKQGVIRIFVSALSPTAAMPFG